jgi:hypothetical protein
LILFRGVRLPKVQGICIWPFVFVKPKSPSKIMLNHERIHLRQQVELFIVFFYIWYIFEWLYFFVKFRNWWKAYHEISFEKEAYQNETNLEYLKNRAFWSFLKYRKSNRT